MIYIWVSVHASNEYNYLFRNALQNYAAVQDFFVILSALYAICIAFLLWKGLSDYDNLRMTLYEEASTLQAINDFLYYIDKDGDNEEIIFEIQVLSLKYINNLLDGRSINLVDNNTGFLKLITGKVSQINTRDENDLIALAEVMKEMSNLSRLRSKRSSYMDGAMSPYLLALLLSISGFLLLPFLMREPNASYVIHVLLFSLTTFFSFLYLTLVDINNPFDGYWHIKTEIYGALKKNLEESNNDTSLEVDAAAIVDKA